MNIKTTKIRLTSVDLLETAKNAIQAYLKRVTGKSAQSIDYVDGVITVTYESLKQLGLEIFSWLKDRLGHPYDKHVSYVLK